MIDFSPVSNKEKKYIDLWHDNNLTVDDLRAVTNESIDFLLELISDLEDADIVFEPKDDGADDPYAVEGEEHIGWTLGHLIAHVTASSEEGAAFSSLLARGVEEVAHRPRYETPWKDIDSKAKTVQRLEESRRMRLAYLDTWPDEPHYDNLRVSPSERFQEYFGDLNAPASFLAGLGHEVGHYDQIKEAKRQALAAKAQA
ncbi:MAG: DinB family protein [Anaerolineae bacterium]|nr:DinB family protein [Anaerolineae bacterium]